MFILLEGLDRSGKSTVAEYFVSEGYQYVHMDAPDKKHYDPDYSGPSYLEEMVEMLSFYDGKDVVFDRTWYGESVWPRVFGRDPLLTTDDLSILKRLEDKNQTKRYLMVDPNVEAHWQRCVDNQEPLDRKQFDTASRLYGRMAHVHQFIPMSLGDFNAQLAGNSWETDNSVDEAQPTEHQRPVEDDKVADAALRKNQVQQLPRNSDTPTQIKEKLEKANSINSILSKRIIKQKGLIYDSIENDVRAFLGEKLSELMGTAASSTNSLSKSEVQILKLFCKQWESKAKRG